MAKKVLGKSPLWICKYRHLQGDPIGSYMCTHQYFSKEGYHVVVLPVSIWRRKVRIWTPFNLWSEKKGIPYSPWCSSAVMMINGRICSLCSSWAPQLLCIFGLFLRRDVWTMLFVSLFELGVGKVGRQPDCSSKHLLILYAAYPTT